MCNSAFMFVFFTISQLNMTKKKSQDTNYTYSQNPQK